MSIDSIPDSLDNYLREIGEHPLLTAEEEHALLVRMAAGMSAQAQIVAGCDDDTLAPLIAAGIAARQELITRNLRLVVSVAKKYVRNGLPLLDLIQEGNLGLMRATEKFDVSLGFRFSTYAVRWIHQHVTRAIDEQVRLIRVPVHMAESTRLLNRIAGRFDHTPTVPELAGALSCSVAKARLILASSKDVRSLDEAIGHDDDPQSLGDIVLAPLEDFSEGAQHQHLCAELTSALGTLCDRERAILQARYGERLTLEETGKAHGITRERARQLEKAALIKLRRDAAGLRAFLEAA